MKVGLIAPCIGVGGGDALMLGLVNHCHNVTFTGIYVRNLIEYKHYDWARRACGGMLPPLHNKFWKDDQLLQGIQYHESESDGIRSAIRDADVVMTWCMHSMDKSFPLMCDIPIIEYIQNSDQYAKDVVSTNKGVPHFYGACSETAAQLIPEGHKRHVIYNGIDTNRVVPRLGRDRQRELWTLKNKKILLYMGRFVKEKHPEMAVTCLQHLPEDWVTVFVGRGYQEQEVYKLAQQLCPERVFFIDPVYHVGDILAASDAFILPSDFEGHSLALCEAWLSGIPTVYTDFEAINELEHCFGPLGTKIPRVSSPQTVAEAILKATSNDDETLAHIANAKNVVWNNFTLPRIAHQWEEFFEYVIHNWRLQKLYGTIHKTGIRKPFTEV
jgi:hypothetical protein